jgi:hypothetical protein
MGSKKCVGERVKHSSAQCGVSRQCATVSGVLRTPRPPRFPKLPFLVRENIGLKRDPIVKRFLTCPATACDTWSGGR